jgi:hypothetical protein
VTDHADKVKEITDLMEGYFAYEKPRAAPPNPLLSVLSDSDEEFYRQLIDRAYAAMQSAKTQQGVQQVFMSADYVERMNREMARRGMTATEVMRRSEETRDRLAVYSALEAQKAAARVIDWADMVHKQPEKHSGVESIMKSIAKVLSPTKHELENP